jgi:hypothetical protein
MGAQSLTAAPDLQAVLVFPGYCSRERELRSRTVGMSFQVAQVSFRDPASARV